VNGSSLFPESTFVILIVRLKRPPPNERTKQKTQKLHPGPSFHLYLFACILDR
jgi:hypothetical protein